VTASFIVEMSARAVRRWAARPRPRPGGGPRGRQRRKPRKRPPSL